MLKNESRVVIKIRVFLIIFRSISYLDQKCCFYELDWYLNLVAHTFHMWYLCQFILILIHLLTFICKKRIKIYINGINWFYPISFVRPNQPFTEISKMVDYYSYSLQKNYWLNKIETNTFQGKLNKYQKDHFGFITLSIFIFVLIRNFSCPPFFPLLLRISVSSISPLIYREPTQNL